MKKVVILMLMALASNHTYAVDGLNLEDVNFAGECGKNKVSGSAMTTGIENHFVGNVLVTNSGKEVFNTQNQNHAMDFAYISVNCVGTEGKNKLVITSLCAAHADVCGKDWYYIIDGNSGVLIAPKNIKSQKTLCDSKCAEKIVGKDLINTIEKWKVE